MSNTVTLVATFPSYFLGADVAQMVDYLRGELAIYVRALPGNRLLAQCTGPQVSDVHNYLREAASVEECLGVNELGEVVRPLSKLLPGARIGEGGLFHLIAKGEVDAMRSKFRTHLVAFDGRHYVVWACYRDDPRNLAIGSRYPATPDGLASALVELEDRILEE